MKRGAFLETRQAQKHQHFVRDCRRFSFTFHAGKLLTKKSQDDQEDLRFQTELLNAMKDRGRLPFRGEVAIRLEFTVSQKEPPLIHKLPKYYLDLVQDLVPKISEVFKRKKSSRNRLLIQNDADIQYLFVSYYQEAQDVLEDYKPKSSFTITVARWSDFLEDVSLLRRIKENDFTDSDDDRRVYSYRHEDLFREEGNEHNNDTFNENKQVLDNPSRSLQRHGGNAAASEESLRFARSRMQEAFLKIQRMSVRNWMGLFSSTTDKQSQVPNLHKLNRSFVFHPYFSIKLPGIPTQRQPPNEPKFKELIRNQIELHFRDDKILNPLMHPLSVSLFFLKPKSVEKDLDNIVLDVAPVIHEFYEPPTLAKVFESVAPTPLKGTPKKMISSYQALRIERLPDDASEGFIQLRFEDGMGVGSHFWRTMDSLIDKWSDTIGR